MSAYRMRCRQHPPVEPSGEPVVSIYVGALRLAETLVGHPLARETNDPASGANAGPGHERLEAAS